MKKVLFSSGLYACILLELCAGVSISISQTTFQRTYGGINNDGGHSVQQTSDGGYIIAGFTDSYGVGSEDVYLVKTNSSGDTLWTRTFGGTDRDRAFSVRQTSDGGYIIAGRTRSFGAGSYDVYLIKTNSTGNPLWTKTYGGPNIDAGSSVQQTSDGGYIIAGSTSSFGTGSADVYLVKTNSSGDTLWTRTFGGTYSDYGNSVQQTSDGGYIVAGEIFTESLLFKMNSSGDLVWAKTYGGHEANSVQRTSDGGYIIAGSTSSSSSSDVYLVKRNSSGDSLWTRTFGGTDRDGAFSVQQTSDGGYIIAGFTDSFGADSSDVYVVKTNSSGDTVWTRTFGGANEDAATSVQQTSDGGYIIAGATRTFGAGSIDVYLIKTQADGIVSVQGEGNVMPTGFTLMQNYPNPFNPSTAIRFSLPQSEFVTLIVFNMLGEEIHLLVFARLSAGTHQAEWDAQSLPSGVYFYRLQAGPFVETKKLLLLR